MLLPHHHLRRAFTMVELLAVIAIVGVLAAIVIAVVGSARAQAHSARCGSNIRQLQALALIWAKDNHDWVPQACWAWKTLPSYMNATNLRSVGYTDGVGTCGAVDDGVTYAPHYGINSQLAAANFASDTTAYYVHGLYKFSAVQSSRTIIFAETKWVSGWSFNATLVTDAAPTEGGKTSAYMATANTFDARHDGKGYVAYADGHVALQTQAQLNVTNPNPWTQGITQ